MGAISADMDRADGVQAGAAYADREELSPIDYKTAVLINMIFGNTVGDFYAGNYRQGMYRILTWLVTPYDVNVIALVRGTYTDGNGKPIRQIIQLKKEELSPLDHTTMMYFCSLLGYHQFLAGKTLNRALMVLSTFTGVGISWTGIWTIMNRYQLATCGFRDGEGKIVCPEHVRAQAV